MLQRLISHILLVPAKDNGTGSDRSRAAGKGDDHFTGNLIKDILLRIDDVAFQGAQQVENRYGGNRRIINGTHIVFSHAAGRDQTEKASVLFRDRKGGHPVIVFMENLPGIRNGHTGTDCRRCIKIDIRYLGTDRPEMERGLKTETVQQEGCFSVQMAVAGSDITVTAEGVLQRRVSHGGNNRIRIRVFVADYIY